jgi:hypothetical protein
LILFAMMGLMFLVGCFKPAQAPELTPISISLVSSLNALQPGQATIITASVYDPSQQGVTWSITPLNFGALSLQTSTSVTYTAPASFTTSTSVTITATSITNPTITSSLQVSVTPITVTFFPPSNQTLSAGPGQQLIIFPTVTNDTTQSVTWSISPSTGAGTLATQTVPVALATYTPPSAVTTPVTALVTATSTNSPAFAAMQITVFPSGGGTNVAAIQVDGGPVPGEVYRNRAYTSVTICNHSSTTACQTVNGILVDTGSYGLRVLQSQIPLLKLSTLTNQFGNTLENCASQPDGSFIWGSVSTADVYIGGELASPVPVQVIPSAGASVPAGCSNGSTVNLNTPQLLGANGILGVGPEPTDCTLAGVNLCDGSTLPEPPNVYYACPAAGCGATDSPVVVAANQQITNPIKLFSPIPGLSGNIDSNGVILQLPPVSGPEASATGTMTFGIATETNNMLGSATVYTLDSNDHFSTVLNGQTLAGSFIDSGADALFFQDSLPDCEVNSSLYCPTSPVTITATNTGATEGQGSVTFTVDNADDLFAASPSDAVFGDVAGPSPTQSACTSGDVSACSFTWGLPFFYGRTVFTAIDGGSVSGVAAPPPWFAY